MKDEEGGPITKLRRKMIIKMKHIVVPEMILRLIYKGILFFSPLWYLPQ